MNKTVYNTLDIAFRDITTFGGAIFYGGVVLFSFILGQQMLARQLLLGFVFTLCITIIIRLLYFRNRPQKQEFHNLLERIDAASFPSLHTSRVVFLTGMGISSFQNSFITLFLIVFAALVIYSRIYLQKHDWIDVIGGIVVGMGTYWGIVHLL